MKIFKTQKTCLLLSIVLLSFSTCPGHSLPPAGTTETTTNQKEVPAGVLPQSEGNNAPLLTSPFNDTPTSKIPFAKPVGNQGQQSQLGYQQQQDPNYPPQSVNQPLSGFNRPYSTITNQPYSGFNQPFGASDQQGSMENAAFHNGVSKQNSRIQGVILVSLLILMVSFWFLV